MYIIIQSKNPVWRSPIFPESISLFVSLSGSHRHNNYSRSISTEPERPCHVYSIIIYIYTHACAWIIIYPYVMRI